VQQSCLTLYLLPLLEKYKRFLAEIGIQRQFPPRLKSISHPDPELCCAEKAESYKMAIALSNHR